MFEIHRMLCSTCYTALQTSMRSAFKINPLISEIMEGFHTEAMLHYRESTSVW